MKEERIWTKGFTTLSISFLLYATGVYMLAPTLPLFLLELGAAESQVGVVATAFFIASILTRFLINVVAGKTGKKRVLIAGLILSTVVMAFYSLADSIGAVTVLRALQGIGLGTTSTIASTIAADLLPDSRRAQGIGYFGMGIVIAMAIAPAIALYVQGIFGFIPMFIIAACTNLISAIMVLVFVKEPRAIKAEPQEKREAKARTIQWQNLFDKKLVISSVFVFLFGVTRSLDLNYISLFAESRKLEYLSLYFLIQTAAMFCIRLVMGRIADRKGRDWALVPGGFAMLAALVILSFADTSALMLLGAVFSGLGSGMLAPNLQVWMLDVVEPEKRNVASASYFSFMDTGSAIGAPLMGLIAEKSGYTIMFRAGACAALVFIIGYFAIGMEKSRRVRS